MPVTTATSDDEPGKKETLQSVLVFDKPKGYVEIPSGISYLGGKFTLEAWIYPTVNVGLRVIYVEGDSIFYLEDNKLKFQKQTTGETISSTNDSITLNAWNHVAVAKSGNKPGETKLYINGKQNDNQVLISKLADAKGAYIGIQPNMADRYFQGKISEVRIWNSDRSQDEIGKDLHHRSVGNEPGLVAYWSFSEGFGTTAHDKTQNAKHGTIHNATWSESLIPIADDPDPRERLLYSTKAEDYKYLYSKLVQVQAPQQQVSFRRGRIWH